MSLSRFSYIILSLIVFVSCSNKHPKEYVDTLTELGWEKEIPDSVFVLFTSVNQCSPCEQEIEEWNSKYANSNKVILIVNEKYVSNFENYLTANSIKLFSIQDEKGLFRKRELIPFLPYKILIYDDKVIDLGELGKD
ncbi:hypothetical protein A8B79_00240 [Balneola sp. EhC07]|jgi:hypothetical protein|uniref:hypothetical protein n=1 Tax=Balneola sp. EhC07 TaxID=1849360 RepID=UPI0007F455BE|nr:hypothetical protein [Balneola sp. EhC07]OAN64610.1 hypothetical protein A8B79_00240 [Balneola sp. EhC07]